MLTQEQIADYHKKGYLGIENVFSPAEVEQLQQVTDEFIEQSRTIAEDDSIFELEPGHAPQTPKVRRLRNPVGQHPAYAQALRNERVLDIVAQLIGPAIRTNGNKLNMKLSELGSPVEWHQDWAFYPHTNDDLLAVGVCIDDMTEENGCLMVVPGSHKGKIYDHHQDGYFIGAVTEADFDDSAAEKVELKAGGLSIHHVRALHGSLPNTSDKPRRLMLFQYCAADAFPIGGGLNDWDQFNSMLLRGEPVFEPRLEKVPVRTPLPKPDRKGGIYELQTQLERSTFNTAAQRGA
ncbi:MAG: phytanoyl-CoA dioxygenase family protein [Candidatus Latescibacterota bacterium]|jgi:phytanoyl-CoA hydroxylase